MQHKGHINTPAHSKAAYDIAGEAIVLLKNDVSMLPLNTNAIKSIAVIGDNATHKFATGGFGAGVKARYEVNAMEGLQSRLGKKVAIRFSQGYSGRYQFNYNTPQKEDANKPNWGLIADAVAVAKTTDVAIVFIGANRDYESESKDRKNLELPFGELELVKAVTAANPNTIVVVAGGAPYDLNEIKKNNHTIVWSWFNGSEGGNALADVLIGKINPSGKLPFTFPASLNDSPAHALGTFPGQNLTAQYKEGILVGYRWFDTKKIEPLYCFGYGLSYTTFGYSALRTNKTNYHNGETIIASLNLKNTGKYNGKEVVQLYISKINPRVERAEQELKAFKKVYVNTGGMTKVSLAIKATDLAYFDTQQHQWIVEPGKYKLLVGSSSRDIRQSASINITE